MARFYFDTQDGQAVDTDDDGVDFPDCDRAKDAAKSILASLVGERLPNGDHIGLTVTVRDEAGNQIYLAQINLDGSEPTAS
jgi:hypothetical protein